MVEGGGGLSIVGALLRYGPYRMELPLNRSVTVWWWIF